MAEMPSNHNRRGRMRVTQTEGHDTVPLRLPRLARAVVVTGLASAPLVGFALSAHAGTAGAATQMSAAAIIGAPPHAKPASSGALPRRLPPPPDVPSNVSVILGDAFTDGVMSAGVLACLLVPIIWYGSIIKRRDRRVALAAADRAQHSRLGAMQRGMSSDPLLDYADPHDVPPAGPRRSLPSPGYQSRPSLSGRSTLTPAFAPRPVLAAPHAAHDEPWSPESDAWSGSAARTEAAYAAHDPWAAADEWEEAREVTHHGERPGPGGFGFEDPGQSEPSTLRHAPVAGAPPWEPAPQPTSELPWAVLSGPAQGPGRRAGLSSAGAGSGGFGSRPGTGAEAGTGQPPAADRRTDSDWRSIEGRRPGSGERPIYIWDPETSAERGGTIRLTRIYQD